MVKTDQQALKFLLEQRVRTETLQKWVSKLMSYDFSIEYKKLKENKATDALSRRDGEEEEVACLAVISFPIPSWLVELKQSYVDSIELADLKNRLKKNLEVPKEIS